MPDRIVAVRIPSDIYQELERKARTLGYSLVSDYVRSIVLRELGYGGTIAQRDVESLVREAVEKKLEQLVASGKIEVKPIDTEKLVETLLKKVERRLQDMVNPWTAKIDELSARISETVEKIEGLEERLEQLENQLTQFREKMQPQQAEARARRRSAMDRLKEQGVVFERDVQWLRDRDAFFERLKKEGAIVLVVGGERVAVDREFWRNFKDKIAALPTANDDEIKILLTTPQYELFSKLKTVGLIYFDATKKTWKFVEKMEEG